jgi:hypothetical protein
MHLIMFRFKNICTENIIPPELETKNHLLESRRIFILLESFIHRNMKQKVIIK